MKPNRPNLGVCYTHIEGELLENPRYKTVTLRASGHTKAVVEFKMQAGPYPRSITAWGEHAEALKSLRRGDFVVLETNASAKSFVGRNGENVAFVNYAVEKIVGIPQIQQQEVASTEDDIPDWNPPMTEESVPF